MKLEPLVGVILRAGVIASSLCLAIGLGLALAAGEGGAAGVLLHTGIVILLATPVARVIVSIGQYARERDWTFTALTAIVLLELVASAAAALLFHRRQ
jgi:uncharacterized membrane protein